MSATIPPPPKADPLASRRFDPGRQIRVIRPRFTLIGKPICTPANLTTISAAPKSGKTAVLGAMIAAAMIADSDTESDALGFYAAKLYGAAVLHFDSEQSPDDHHLMVLRTLKRAQVEHCPKWFLSFYLTGLAATQAKDFVWAAAASAVESCASIHSIFIDGAADLVSDVNSAEESNRFVAELHGLAVQYDCPIISVIHFNPGSDKTRGHLGSQLERKSETNLRLDKGADGVVEMWSDKQRRAPIPKGTGPCFAWSAEADMHVRVDNPAEERAKAKEHAQISALSTDAKAVYLAAGKPALSWKDLTVLIAGQFTLKKEGARKRFEKWRDSGVITKDAADNWILTP